MTFATKGPPPGHGGDPLELSFPSDFQPNSPKRTAGQTECSGVVPFPPRIRPPRPRSHLVRLSVSGADGRSHGRSRAFRLDERDVEQLVDFLLELEERRA